MLHLDGEVDYRLNGLRDAKVYFTPLGNEATQALDAAYRRLAGGASPIAETLMVQGREVRVPAANRGIARFDFADLCEQPLGAADYLAVARHYHTVLLADVPALTPEQRNQARRLALLVDVFYDHNVKLIMSAAVPPDELYKAGTGTFEFQRTASRLIEMQTGDYLSGRHVI